MFKFQLNVDEKYLDNKKIRNIKFYKNSILIILFEVIHLEIFNKIFKTLLNFLENNN